MPKKPGYDPRDYTTVRITRRTYNLSRLASSYLEETTSDYINRVLSELATKDIATLMHKYDHLSVKLEDAPS